MGEPATPPDSDAEDNEDYEYDDGYADYHNDDLENFMRK